MSTTTQKIVPDGKHQQLIDLNKNATNFICEFSITPHVMDLETEYHVAIATQSQLDNTENIDMKPLKGIFNGSVKIESNEYQNYFMVIKTDAPMREMEIMITLTELPVHKPPEPTLPPQPVVEQQPVETSEKFEQGRETVDPDDNHFKFKAYQFLLYFN
jgi:hypothetical protein